VFTFGSNDSGQLGVFHNTFLPTQLALKQIKQVSAGAYHSAFLTNTGALYVTGNNQSGQLGLGHTNDLY
jgi:alpha-tubulin suppressor-like RCC1 family protein